MPINPSGWSLFYSNSWNSWLVAWIHKTILWGVATHGGRGSAQTIILSVRSSADVLLVNTGTWHNLVTGVDTVLVKYSEDFSD